VVESGAPQLLHRRGVEGALEVFDTEVPRTLMPRGKSGAVRSGPFASRPFIGGVKPIEVRVGGPTQNGDTLLGRTRDSLAPPRAPSRGEVVFIVVVVGAVQRPVVSEAVSAGIIISEE
jgi:hypothetical protein